MGESLPSDLDKIRRLEGQVRDIKVTADEARIQLIRIKSSGDGLQRQELRNCLEVAEARLRDAQETNKILKEQNEPAAQALLQSEVFDLRAQCNDQPRALQAMKEEHRADI